MLPKGTLYPRVAGGGGYVERCMMSFPRTTRLSIDFFKSRVSVSVEKAVSALPIDWLG